MEEKYVISFFNTFYREERNVVEKGTRRQQCQSFLLNITERYEGRSHMSNLLVKKQKSKMSLGVFGVFALFPKQLKTIHLQDDSLHLPKANLMLKCIKSQEG